MHEVPDWVSLFQGKQWNEYKQHAFQNINNLGTTKLKDKI